MKGKCPFVRANIDTSGTGNALTVDCNRFLINVIGMCLCRLNEEIEGELERYERSNSRRKGLMNTDGNKAEKLFVSLMDVTTRLHQNNYTNHPYTLFF